MPVVVLTMANPEPRLVPVLMRHVVADPGAGLTEMGALSSKFPPWTSRSLPLLTFVNVNWISAAVDAPPSSRAAAGDVVIPTAAHNTAAMTVALLQKARPCPVVLLVTSVILS